MTIGSKFFNTIRRFCEDRSGNMFIIAGLTAFAVFSCAGAAVDFTRISSTKSKMTNALDAAVLATGVDLSKGETDIDELRATFEDFFYANIAGANGNREDYRIVAFNADSETGEVSAKAENHLEMTLMRIAGRDAYTVSAEAAGRFDQTDIEVAMMLDVTGSMRGSKISDLKLAATDAVDILIPDDKRRGVRIGLVPYASSVNAGKHFAPEVTAGGELEVAGAGGGLATPGFNVPTDSCVTGRGGRDAATDASYKDAPLGSDRRTVQADRASLRCPKATIQALTSDRAELKRQIGKYRAEGYTAGHLGVAWSYYLLSENWQPLYRTENRPAAYSAGVRKIAILMTDGEFNTAFEGIGGNPFGRNVAASNDRAKALCDDMKARKSGNPGITVYAIAFKAPSSAEATLRACANEDTERTTFYYSADSGEELRKAFREIAASISNLRISR